MSDEKEERPAENEGAAHEREAAGEGGAESEQGSATESEPPRPRVDEDGLPLDREPTIDDVRSTSGLHGRYAMGCTIFIVILILAFWFIRAGIGG